MGFANIDILTTRTAVYQGINDDMINDAAEAADDLIISLFPAAETFENTPNAIMRAATFFAMSDIIDNLYALQEAEGNRNGAALSYEKKAFMYLKPYHIPR